MPDDNPYLIIRQCKFLRGPGALMLCCLDLGAIKNSVSL
jgi:hypothetical protein